MIRFLARRVVSSCLLLLLILSITFLILQLVPGNPISRFDNPRLTQEQIEHMRQAWGLERPLHIQYFSWMRQVLFHGDLGISFGHRRPVAEVLKRALPKTLLLGITSLILQYVFGLLLGTFTALREGSLADSMTRLVSLVVYSIPTFWLALMAILLFHLKWHLLPGSGLNSVGADDLTLGPWLVDRLRHLILPAMVLGVSSAAGVARFVRNSLLEVLKQDYIRTARATGASESRILWRHSLRNALAPLAQLFGLSLPAVLNGVLIIEVVFGWPGIGQIMFQACLARDYPLILGGTAYGAILVIAGTLLADLLHRWADPRIRQEG